MQVTVTNSKCQTLKSIPISKDMINGQSRSIIMVVWANGQEKKEGIIRTQANKKPLLIKSDQDQ